MMNYYTRSIELNIRKTFKYENKGSKLAIIFVKMNRGIRHRIQYPSYNTDFQI